MFREVLGLTVLVDKRMGEDSRISHPIPPAASDCVSTATDICYDEVVLV